MDPGHIYGFGNRTRKRQCMAEQEDMGGAQHLRSTLRVVEKLIRNPSYRKILETY